MLKKFLKWGSVSLAVLILAGSLLFVNFWYFKPLSIDWFYSRAFLKFSLQQPEMLTSLRILDQFGIRGHNAELSDASPEANEEILAYWREQYETFKRYDRSDYEGQDLLSYDVFDFFMSNQLAEADRWRFHNFPVNQMFGVQSTLPDFMVQQHVVEDELGAEHYIARLNEFDEKFDGVLEGLRVREERGILPPSFAVTKVIDQIEGFLDSAPDEHMLVVEFDEKMESIDKSELPTDRREELREQAVTAVAQSVYPAYEDLLAYLRELEPKATSNGGVWRLPDGEAFYKQAIRQHTTTEMSAGEIHDIGLAEVERIGREMDAILRAEGLTEGTIGERVQRLSERPDQLYPDTDEGREQILAEYQKILDEIDPAMDEYFNLRPETGVQVKRVPEFAEETSAGAYYQRPSMDGKRQGTFFANLRDVSEVPKFGMRTLAYHEGIPGHHFQIAITQQLDDIPMFRRLVPFTAYSEGWALYAEQLAREIGFQDDPLDNLGRLQAEMFRAVRLVVDTGLHHKRWTREEAIDYMLANTGMGEGEVEAEIERYLVMPGQALAYKVGMMKILELRERARRELGDDFSLPEFHDQILGHGALPLTLLEEVVDKWIEEERSV
ncbi:MULTISPECIES: DUF885 family protein [unclassified Wenzhouxiangella]|uniref:DUF885 domain-containing protein n=1 Tax=unclassified Wenzhouxiangella TaxID=2613841 RepID=UPI000E32B62E|nr:MULTISPECIES: DUF885 domain-containing protein [unclassified Wenzhouxiangella]RFF28997.1 DUF885 domain-containing protein [Wenzhouxiangella sp. 15181]RFP68297.1 DUF885 domain-containing protein [Wenzhouxiangella sp. 15190]